MTSLGVASMASSPSMVFHRSNISKPGTSLWSQVIKICPKQNISTLQRIPLKFKHGTVSAISRHAEGEESMKGLSNTGEDGPLMIKYSGEKPPTPLLDTINYPIHMKNFNIKELRELAKELREDIIFSVTETGGHLSGSLGVVDLTVALHYVFNTPHDKIVWDVGHQSYPHKILIGRRSRMGTLRQTSGLAGFPRHVESEHDAFGAGHRSTSISAALGMAVGRDLLGKHNHVIAVIGDGAMTAGQAYEAMNNAGFLDSNMIIILNDNKQVSLPTTTIDGPASLVSALSTALCRLQASKKFRKLREVAKDFTHQVGGVPIR